MTAETAEKKELAPESNVKETVESILVAFILAFIFRAFVVEAFVIPTGSMAPTLYGAHMRFQCPDCGTTFDTGYSVPEGVDIPSEGQPQADYHCPNCGLTFNNSTADGAKVFKRVRFGDRILVLKYINLLEKPHRGDTVVFKSPSSTEKIPSDPEYSVNFIKRLIGIGPETVVILDGDIYIGDYGSRDFKSFKIWRKPQSVQNVLWRSVYDNDFIPHLATAPRSQPWEQPWQEVAGKSGWDLGVGGRSRAFNFNGAASGSIQFDDHANPDTHSLTDFLVYDEREQLGQRDPQPVSDLRLACTYTRKSGDGPLRLQLTKLADCFTVEVRPGKVILLRSKLAGSGKTQEIVNEQAVMEKQLPELAGATPARIELSNVDYRVSVRVNGQEVLYQEYNPDVAMLWTRATDMNTRGEMLPRPTVNITAAGQQCTIEHLLLSRDIYYLNNDLRHKWGVPSNPIDLKAGEYFVLGDNSLISGDGRFWDEPINLPREGMAHVDAGRVPEQFMLGKAFFVYWPAGYTVPYTGVNIVPDFGDMRFIH